MTRRLLLGSLVAAGMLAAGQPMTAGKASPLQGPVTATFRCPTTVAGDDCSLLPRPDRITGDGATYVGVGSPSTGYGAFIDSVGELKISLESNGPRFLHLDFSELLSQPCAATTAGCKRSFPMIDANVGVLLHTNTLDPTGQTELSGGLGSIPLGQSRPSRIKLLFQAVRSAAVACFLSSNRNFDAAVTVS